MGKRKERRLAALSAAGRRVKLDLFAEPSGDVVNTSVNDEVGGDLDQNDCAGCPISPSSGKQQENPLALLGQYSDDELDDEASKRLKHEDPSSSSNDQSGQVLELVDGDDVEGNLTSHDVKPENMDKEIDAVQNINGNDIGETGAISPCIETDLKAQIDVPGTSEIQIVGDVAAGWRVVMHEESNQYYYWNTVTGETSWEVPSVLVQGAEEPNEPKVPSVEDNGSALDVYVSNSNFNGEPDGHSDVPTVGGPRSTDLVIDDKVKHDNGVEMETQHKGDRVGDEDHLNLGSVADQIESHHNSTAFVMSPSNTPEARDSICVDQLNGVLSGNRDKHHIVTNDKGVSSSQLVKYAETLLQRLRSLEGYHSGDTQRQKQMSKCLTEIEIRLSDCKALSSYGSPLLPFWLHSEVQLKQLESVILEEEVSHFAESERLNEVETANISYCKGDVLETMEAGTEVHGKSRVLPSIRENAYIPSTGDILNETLEKAMVHAPDSEDAERKQDLLLESPKEVLQEADENAGPVSLVPKIVTVAGGDMDMDVDMEVDDETSASHLTSEDVKHSSSPEPAINLNPTPPFVEPAAASSLEELSVPPPPDEEWIPPPPPDNEIVPPPPPDEPPAPSYPPPPTYDETVPSFCYTEQYSVSYPVPTFEFYAPTMVGVTSANYYSHTEGSQISETQPPPYFEPAPTVFTEAAPAIINPMNSVMYYDLQNGSVPPAPVIGSLDYYGESVSVSYHDTTVSGPIESVGVDAEATCTSLSSLKAETDFTKVRGETEVANVQVESTSATAQTSVTTLGNETGIAATSAAAIKNQPKVVRSKKRTVAVAPSLRSNKKVSSLVDKWKAAKEELHGDEEDEPQDAYEILEKKRQREIEEWRAQQIASGEAQGNANFQPLGGDWRERVRRKKAQSTSEGVQTPPEVAAVEKQQPDLVELSKDLAPGWQAYWDESSKGVYYGNVNTSETTWTRPT